MRYCITLHSVLGTDRYQYRSKQAMQAGAYRLAISAIAHAREDGVIRSLYVDGKNYVLGKEMIEQHPEFTSEKCDRVYAQQDNGLAQKWRALARNLA